MNGFYLTNDECSGCGLRSCDGRCFMECPSDYDDEAESLALTDKITRELTYEMRRDAA